MSTELQGSANPNHEGIIDISVKDVHDQMGSLTLIDVRRPDEWKGEYGHISSAKMITLDTLPENIDEIPTDKPIVFICRSGGRSGQAAAFAKENGIDNVYNMKGGMIAWTESNFEVEDKNAN